MRTTLRMFITVLATFALTFTGVGYAQEGDPVAECEATGGLWMEDFEGVEGLDICHKYGHEIVECEAQGGEHRVTPSGQYCDVDGVSHTLQCGYPDPGACDSAAASTEPVTEPAEVESETAESPPSAKLPATQPAPASPGAPQYTG